MGFGVAIISPWKINRILTAYLIRIEGLDRDKVDCSGLSFLEFLFWSSGIDCFAQKLKLSAWL